MEQKLIYKKITTIMKDMSFIGREKYNDIQKFKYRGIDQFVNELHPEFFKNNVFLNPMVKEIKYSTREVLRSNGKPGIDTHCTVLVEYHFICSEDNSYMIIGPFPGEGIDSSDKATYKAMTGALKNMLIEVFMVPTEQTHDPDADHIDNEPVKQKISNSLNEKKVSIPKPNETIVPDEIKKELWASVKSLGFDDEGAKKWFILVTNKQHSKEWNESDISLIRKKIQDVKNNNPQVLEKEKESDNLFV